MQCSDLFFKRSLTSVVSILEEKPVQQQEPRLENILRAAYKWGEGCEHTRKGQVLHMFWWYV